MGFHNGVVQIYDQYTLYMNLHFLGLLTLWLMPWSYTVDWSCLIRPLGDILSIRNNVLRVNHPPLMPSSILSQAYELALLLLVVYHVFFHAWFSL